MNGTKSEYNIGEEAVRGLDCNVFSVIRENSPLSKKKSIFEHRNPFGSQYYYNLVPKDSKTLSYHIRIDHQPKTTGNRNDCYAVRVLGAYPNTDSISKIVHSKNYTEMPVLLFDKDDNDSQEKNMRDIIKMLCDNLPDDVASLNLMSPSKGEYVVFDPDVVLDSGEVVDTAEETDGISLNVIYDPEHFKNGIELVDPSGSISDAYDDYEIYFMTMSSINPDTGMSEVSRKSL